MICVLLTAAHVKDVKGWTRLLVILTLHCSVLLFFELLALRGSGQ